jgi:hypothetical protein
MSQEIWHRQQKYDNLNEKDEIVFYFKIISYDILISIQIGISIIYSFQQKLMVCTHIYHLNCVPDLSYTNTIQFFGLTVF